MKNRDLYRIALEGFALAGCLVLLFSCISFNIWDEPSDLVFPTNSEPANWCGSIGAFLAYYLMYYIGPGVFVLLVSLAGALGANLAGVKITQPLLRGAGLLLVVIALSSTWYLLWPGQRHWPYGSGGFAEGNGGIPTLPRSSETPNCTYSIVNKS